MSDKVFQKAVINSEKEPEFQNKKEQLRSKVLEMTDLKNEHNKKYEELSELDRPTVVSWAQYCAYQWIKYIVPVVPQLPTDFSANVVVLRCPTCGSSFFLGKVTALGVLCCFALLFI